MLGFVKNKEKLSHINTYGQRISGFTILELAVVFVVLGLGTAGVLWAVSEVQQNRNEKDSIALLAEVRQAVNESYGDRASYRGLETTDVTARLGKERDLTHPFGGRVTVSPGDYRGGTDNVYVVLFEGLSGAACRRLATALPLGKENIMVTVSGIDNETFYETPSSEQASRVCAEGNDRTILWAFN